jgi:hypothetical protein
LDPSHLPFTHDGTLSKRAKATEMKVEMIFDNTGAGGASAGNSAPQQEDHNYKNTTGFDQPFAQVLLFKTHNKSKINQEY